LDDNKKLWRADGKTFGKMEYPVLEYTKSKQSRPISLEDEDYVKQKLRERSRAKLKGDFDTSDDILDELRFLKNVVVDDESLTWKVTEPFKTEYTYGGKRLQNIRQEEIQKIERMVKERSEAKDRKDFFTADSILNELELEHRVRVDDVKKAWYFLSKNGEDMKDYQPMDQGVKRNKRVRNVKGSRDTRGPRRTSNDSKGNYDKEITLPSGIAIINDAASVQNDEPVHHETLKFQSDDDKISIIRDESVAICSTPLNDALEGYTVPMLKEKLRKAGLPVSGRKAELIDRLRCSIETPKLSIDRQ